MKRNILYLGFISAFAASGCGLCAIMRMMAARRMPTLFAEEVTDRGVRAGIRAAHGFGGRHATAAPVLGSALGAALTYQDVVAELRRSISSAPKAPTFVVAGVSAAVLRRRRSYPPATLPLHRPAAGCAAAVNKASHIRVSRPANVL